MAGGLLPGLPGGREAGPEDLIGCAAHHGLVSVWPLAVVGLEVGLQIGLDLYSGLLGRYLARAYLTWNEGVRVLVPFDTAKRIFRNTSYRLIKQPSGHGLEADWIGLDARQRLVIVEAKGTFNACIRAWKDTNSLPAVLRTAIGQA